MVDDFAATNDGEFLWQDYAKCNGQDTRIFFNDDSKEAKAICLGCPVKAECLEHALVYNNSGVWGGLTDKERRQYPKQNTKLLRDDYIESGIYNNRLKV